MFPETKPILFRAPASFHSIEIYPIHDMHYGNECFNLQRWNALKKEILEQPNRYVVWIGDLMENAIPGSKSDVFSQMYTPLEQREFVAEQFKDLADRTISINDGNHEYSRSTRAAGLYPLYDCACIAGIEDKYRSAYSVIDVSVGNKDQFRHRRPTHYILFTTHHAKALKSFASCDALDGFDIFLYGHDHDSIDHPRGKLIYDQQTKTVQFRPIEMINCGSFLNYSGGYSPRSGFRPSANKFYKLILSDGGKDIVTVGSHPGSKSA